MTEKRDLKADLEICDRTTPGPWAIEKPMFHSGVIAVKNDSAFDWICSMQVSNQPNFRNDADFIATAREGWPEAIKRAIAAEYELARVTSCADGLRNQLAYLTEENDIQRQGIQNLSAQAVGLRDGLEKILNALNYGDIQEIAASLLSSPDPGEKYRQVVEICLKKKAITDEWQGIEENCFRPSKEFIETVYKIKDLDRQLDEALASLKGGGE